VVDVGGGPEPQLGAVAPAAVHHGEVVDARHQQPVLVRLRQLAQAADQQRDLLALEPSSSHPRDYSPALAHKMCPPVSGCHHFHAQLILLRISKAGLDFETRMPVEDL